MGYCSDVVVIISKAAFLSGVLEQKIPKMLNDQWVEKSKTTKAFYYKWQDIKWYAVYLDILNIQEI